MQPDRQTNAPERSRPGRAAAVLVGFLLCLSGCVARYSTDIPLEYHKVLEDKYLGKEAWTRLTLQDEKKNVKIEQDQEVVVTDLGLERSGAVTIESPNGRKRVVYPFHIARPLTLEQYEKALLDALWFESPDVRYAHNKEKYGTRIADAIRDHKVVTDMAMQVAYLTWGAPTKVIATKRGSNERWEYDTANLKKASIDFAGGKVAHVDGENVSDTEAASKRKRMRRTS